MSKRTTRTHTTTTSKARQQRRDQQLGILRRSTVVALMCVAVTGIGLSQYKNFSSWADAGRNQWISWTSDKGFTVERVDVVGRTRVPSDFMMGALKITRGAPILNYDIKSAQERLAENPWFKSVNVERRLPETIFIRVTERVPVARWQVDGKLALVDAEGITLPTNEMAKYSNLPVIIGQDARGQLVGLFGLMNAEPEIGAELAAATWVGNRRWDLKLKNNVIIKLPEAQPEVALSHLSRLNKADQLLERDIESVDMRLPSQAIIQPTIRANALIERPDFSATPSTSRQNI